MERDSQRQARIASENSWRKRQVEHRVLEQKAAAFLTSTQPEETPKLIEAEVQVQVSLSVNRELTSVTRTVRSGESFTFEAAHGLIVEATPMMYEDDWIDVHLNYYEEGATGRRRLSGGSISTAHARQSDGLLATGGSSGTVLTGRKGYAVETSVNAKVM